MVQQASILIVDDDANHRRTMSLILEHKGYLVTAAGDDLSGLITRASLMAGLRLAL